MDGNTFSNIVAVKNKSDEGSAATMVGFTWRCLAPNIWQASVIRFTFGKTIR